MIIANNKEVTIGVFDIETLKELFDIGIYNPDTDTWIEFEISNYKNDLYSFVKYYTSTHYDYYVSFNGISFDHQVLQLIVNEHDKWFDLSGLEICNKIYNFVQKLIDDQKYDLFLPYKEYQFPVKVIDLFKIHHFDNPAKRTSLKWIEFMMNMDVEEMSIAPDFSPLTEKHISDIKGYRKTDIFATLGLLYLTLGELDKLSDLIKRVSNIEINLDELDDYKGKNKIQDRFDVMKETGLNCLNWSDVKIGEEWNKTDYKNAENIKDDSQLFTKKVKHPFGQKFKNFFPKTLSFTTPLLQDFVKSFGDEFVKNLPQEFKIKIGNTTYTIAKGGLHSTEKNRKIVCQQGWILRDADVGSQYPNSIVKLLIYAPHLKVTILNQYKSKIDKRIKYKKIAKELEEKKEYEEARTYMSIQEMLKLCLNGGYYGKLGQPGSFLEYPEGLLKVCIGNQIEILMLIEMMESNGIQVISGNTDGIVCYFPKEKEELYNKICAEWEEKVGNSFMGKLEYTDFSVLCQDSVNSYIGKKVNGKIKKKGAFMTQYELNKNKSKRIVPLALEAYFIDGKDPIKFITNHKNIFDFCIGKKAFGKLHYEELDEDKCIATHHKIIRYYISKEGTVLKKRGINNNGDPMDNHSEATDKDYYWLGQPKVKRFNKAVKYNSFEDYKINYSYYIMEVLKRIDNIEKTKKTKSYADSFKEQIQTKLFI